MNPPRDQGPDLAAQSPVAVTLQQSEERFRLLVESVKDYAIFWLDPKGYVASWNSGAERIKGYAAHEIIGQHFSLFYPEEEVTAGKCEMKLLVAAKQGRYEDEGWRVRKDGSRFWANVVITALRDDSGEVIGFAKVTRDLSERRAAELERLRLGESARARVHALAALSENLAGALTVEDVGRAAVQQGIDFAQAKVVTLYLLNDLGILELIAERGCAVEMLEHIRRIGPDSGNPFYAIGAGGRGGVWIESRQQYEEIAPQLAHRQVDGPRVQAFSCMPLIAEGRTIGMLGIGYHEARTFSDNEREFIGTFARQCAQALARARAIQAERRSAQLAEQLRASLATPVHRIGDAVIATDSSGMITLMNAVAESLTGYTEAEALGRPLRDVFDIVNEDTGEPVASPVTRVLETGGVVGLANHTVLLARDGRRIPIDDSGAPIRAGNGPIDGVVLVFRDVTERKRAEERQHFLADAMSILGQSLDYERTVAQVATLAVPTLADWCAVDLLVDGEATPKRLAVAHGDPEKVELARKLYTEHPPRPDAPSGVPAVLRTGRPELYAELPEELLKDLTGDEQLRFARSLELRSAMIVPITAGGRVLGALTLVSAESKRTYTMADLAFAHELARRCGSAIDNARLYQTAQQARQAADVANRAKDEFLAVVSHELRTPLNAIMGWSKLLARGDFDDRRRQLGLETIERNSAAMAQLIEDLLDMSRVISGKMRLEAQPTDVSEVADAALESIRPAAASKGVELEAVLDPEAPAIVADPTRLQQVVWNLLSNAVKFTPKGGLVRVQVRRLDGVMEIEVKDSGRGIAPDFLPHIFDAFSQDNSGNARSRAGLGLGLAISKQLVELHGGRIVASSDGEGQGASFLVTLPIEPRSEQAPESLVERRALAPEQAAQLHGARILVVEDDDDARHLLVTILEQQGCQVHAVSNVAAAMSSLAERVPDVVLSDVAMPGEDGYSLIQQVRRLPRSRGGDVPVAAITAFARPDDRRQLLNAGFSIHLAKPIDPSEVLATVTTLTRFRRHSDAPLGESR